eukprot:196280_1
MALLQIAFCLLIGSSIAAQAPCDIFASGNTPCVAAHSTVRALFGAFNGALYQVKRLSDNATHDISVTIAGGFADAASQDTFCQKTKCVIQRIYDQSSFNNHLDIAPAGGTVRHPDKPVNATRSPLTVSGNNVYAAYFEGDMGYRIDQSHGVAVGNDPETIYMVTSGRHYNGGCCFDYGNAETNNNDDGRSTMEALYFGNSTGILSRHGAGNGPWIMADLENGLWAGNEKVNAQNTPINAEYVFAMLKGGDNGFALKGGDANGASLKVLFDGPRPSGYQPMHKQGSIILGIGGDNSDSAIGTFFEGAMTKGYTTNAIDTSVYNNIVAVKYGH